MKQVLHRVRSSASSFYFQYLLVSLRSSSSCLRLIPRLLVISYLPSNFPSVSSFKKQFLRKIWPVQSAFLLFMVCRILHSSLILCNSLFSFYIIGRPDLHSYPGTHLVTVKINTMCTILLCFANLTANSRTLSTSQMVIAAIPVAYCSAGKIVTLCYKGLIFRPFGCIASTSSELSVYNVDVYLYLLFEVPLAKSR
jgi:hypothetical protein